MSGNERFTFRLLDDDPESAAIRVWLATVPAREQATRIRAVLAQALGLEGTLAEIAVRLAALEARADAGEWGSAAPPLALEPAPEAVDPTLLAGLFDFSDG